MLQNEVEQLFKYFSLSINLIIMFILKVELFCQIIIMIIIIIIQFNSLFSPKLELCLTNT